MGRIDASRAAVEELLPACLQRLRLHREDGLSLANVITFNLDEYFPMQPHELQSYVRHRLTDGAYRDLRKAVLEVGDVPVSMEIQDLYLADESLPSRTGKLVEANRRRYPYLGTSIGLVKKGTYSALTRSFVLLALTPEEELDAFKEFDPDHNPFHISEPQAIVLLYSLIDNDAEVLFPLFGELLTRISHNVGSARPPDLS